MKITPQICTERLSLQAVQLEDAVDVFGYVQNPNVLRYTTANPPKHFKETESFIRSLVEAGDDDYAWAIRLIEAAEVIGIVEFGLNDVTQAGLHYGLSESFWNQGIMSESVQAVLNWAFTHIGELQTVTSAAMTANPASTRVQEKCGMTVQKVEHQTWAKFEERVEVALCTISRKEWQNIQGEQG